VFVNWFEACAFCEWLSRREGLPYRLPTEAEWEYACRAGTTTAYHTGDSLSAEFHKNVGVKWFPDPSRGADEQEIPELTVGQTPPNPWGLYDMHGNVAEWCQDFYAESYTDEDAVHDPRGPASGEDRVLRGGSWAVDEDSCRSSARNFEAPGFADVCFGYEAYGFRCVRR
jgi:formylglycine-generating enzyme required for sulfatase activity